MNQHYEISRDIVAGILLTLCVVISATFLPFLALPIRIITPLPILYYRSKLGREQGLLITIISSLVITVFLKNMTPDILVVFGLMFVGLVLGEFLEKKLTIELTMFYSSSVILSFITIFLFFYSIKIDINLLDIVSTYINRNIDIFLQICKETGIVNDVTTILEQRREDIIYSAMFIMPSSALITITLIEWVNIMAAKYLMQKNNISYPDFGKLNHWYAPDSLVWGLISFGLILLIDNKTIQFIGLNGLLIVITVYFFQGISIISFYLEKKKIHTAAKIAIYLLIAINQIFLIIVIGIGVFDVWFNFRKIEARRSDSF